MMCTVVTFYTTAAAMALEAACRDAGIAGKLFSAPRSLSADCGIAWQSPPEQAEALKALIARENLETEGVYAVEL